eukprot:1146253-Pelagomonas_calceolata.AAC.2
MADFVAHRSSPQNPLPSFPLPLRFTYLYTRSHPVYGPHALVLDNPAWRAVLLPGRCGAVAVAGLPSACVLWPGPERGHLQGHWQDRCVLWLQAGQEGPLGHWLPLQRHVTPSIRGQHHDNLGGDAHGACCHACTPTSHAALPHRVLELLIPVLRIH